MIRYTIFLFIFASFLLMCVPAYATLLNTIEPSEDMINPINTTVKILNLPLIHINIPSPKIPPDIVNMYVQDSNTSRFNVTF